MVLLEEVQEAASVGSYPLDPKHLAFVMREMVHAAGKKPLDLEP